MINLIGPLDPTTPYPQQIDTKIGNELGVIVVHNLSPYEVAVQLGDNGISTLLVGAWGWRRLDIGYPTARMNWQIVATPSQSNPPLSVLFLETTTVRAEATPQYFGTYTRQTSIGNNVQTSGAGGTAFLKNDGNAPATSLIEATPSDQATSSWSLNNDASGSIAVLSAGQMRSILAVTRGNATTGKAAIVLGDAGDTSLLVVHGTADNATNASNVPVAGIGAGALPSGVTVPGGQVTGDIAANQVGPGALDADVTMAAPQITAGALPSGVTIAGSQVSGAVASATSATSATNASNVPVAGIGAGALPSGVTVPGGQVTGDIAANQVGPGALDADVTMAAPQITAGALPSGVTIAGSQVSGAVASATSATSATNATHLGASGNPQISVFHSTATGGIVPDAMQLQVVGFVNGTATGWLFQCVDAAGSYHNIWLTPDGTMVLNGGKLGAATEGDMLDASDGVNLYIKAIGAAGQIRFQVPGGTTVAHIDSTGLYSGAAAKLTATTGLTGADQFGWATSAGGVAIRNTSRFAGVGSGTYSHGMNNLTNGATPNMCDVTTSLANSTQTVGYDSLGSSTVHINTGAGYQFTGVVSQT